jgi:hypothetical protein
VVDEFALEGGEVSEVTLWVGCGGELAWVGFGLLDLRLEPTRFLNREDIEKGSRGREGKKKGRRRLV